MKPASIVVILMAIILLLSVTSHAQDERPETPYIQYNVCPFECCQFGTWTARSLLKAHKREDDNTAIAFTIKPGEKFIALEGNVHIVKLGMLILEKTVGNFIKGDKIYILTYRGEGFYDLWYKGEVLDLEAENLDKVWANSKIVNYPEFIWWVLVKNKDGKQGWLRLKNNMSDGGFGTEEQFDGADKCS